MTVNRICVRDVSVREISQQTKACELLLSEIPPAGCRFADSMKSTVRYFRAFRGEV